MRALYPKKRIEFTHQPPHLPGPRLAHVILVPTAVVEVHLPVRLLILRPLADRPQATDTGQYRDPKKSERKAKAGGHYLNSP